MIRTYKYRLYPNKKQRHFLGVLLSLMRDVYNRALAQRITHYETTQQNIPYPEQWVYFRDEKRLHPETLGQLNTTSIQQMLRRLNKTFQAFFRRMRSGEEPGFPRFKGIQRFKSLEYRYGDGCKLRWPNDRPRFYMQRVGEIRIKYHRPIPSNGIIKHVVIKQSSGKWYVCFQVHLPNIEPSSLKTEVIGVDMGLTSLLALSNGILVENPHWLQQSIVKLRIAQRTLHRRKKGSQRRRKAASQVAKLYEKITNQRRDFWHKLTHHLVNQYGMIGIEDLPLAFMTQNPYLARSAYDASLGLFKQFLSYKAVEAGTVIIAVNPQHTSQRCSKCGILVKKDLAVRVHRCPHCNLKLDRDVNAARNILELALQTPLGRNGQDITWVIASSVS